MREDRKWTNTIIASLVAVVLFYFLFPPVYLRVIDKYLPPEIHARCLPVLMYGTTPLVWLYARCPPYHWFWEKEAKLFGLRK